VAGGLSFPVPCCCLASSYFLVTSSKERTQTSADMGKGRHVVIDDVIHDDNEIGNISYQDVALHEYCNFHT